MPGQEEREGGKTMKSHIKSRKVSRTRISITCLEFAKVLWSLGIKSISFHQSQTFAFVILSDSKGHLVISGEVFQCLPAEVE